MFIRQLTLVLCSIALVANSARAQNSTTTVCEPLSPDIARRDPTDEALDSALKSINFDWMPKSCPQPCYRVWFEADAMISQISGASTPPLITGSPAGIPIGTAAVVGQPNTSVLFGGNDLNASPYIGARFAAGVWLNSCRDRGVEIVGFFLPEQAVTGQASGPGTATSNAVGRPFLDATTGKQAAALSAFANQLTGSSAGSLTTDLWGMELNALARTETMGPLPLTFTAGVRYLDLDQHLGLQDVSTPNGTAAIPFAGILAITNPNSVRVIDTFQTRNQFYGAQLGVRTSYLLGRVELAAGGKFALGATHQTLLINGQTEVLNPNGQLAVLAPGGLLANASNIGTYTRNVIDIVPELDLKLGYRLTPRFTVHVGYNFLYWGNVAAAGNQLPRTVNLATVPTSGAFNLPAGLTPNATISDSRFTVSTIMLGGSFRF